MPAVCMCRKTRGIREGRCCQRSLAPPGSGSMSSADKGTTAVEGAVFLVIAVDKSTSFFFF